ncbi:portal protein [Prosthecochloris sp. SCSIO W1101]|uniref:portal protein n=1 Tax=Prosthecochloris sp. SCSIO W1101 TaxID=2992242 RepID=UPI00223DCFE8|nr:portal protein [Prosthecochloris sp. SCSIO W1101]UZJ42201.1 portal protein [Prosthecochloris sp. SCSIO W1101]
MAFSYVPTSLDAPEQVAEFLKLARERYADAVTFWRDNYWLANEDLKFAYADQWDDEAKSAMEGMPCLTLNKIPAFIDQVVGDQRQNRPSIKVHAVESDSVTPQNPQLPLLPGQDVNTRPVRNIAGTKDYSEAELREAIIKNIEYSSNAEAHFDTAFQHATECGFGWLRVFSKWSDDDVWSQDLVIKSIRNRFSVLMDPDGVEEPDFSCANWCFISQNMRKKAFEALYPDASLGSLGDHDGDYSRHWRSEGMVKVAEYFWREPVERRLLLLSDGRTVWEDEVRDVLDELQASGIVPVRDRVVDSHKVMWAKITAHSILEGPTELPFRTIPVVPVLGKEVTIDNYTFYRGLVRYARDAQKMHNYWMSKATARVALAPLSPYILDAESIEGFEHMWKQANKKPWSYLPFRHRSDVPAPRREMPPQMPAAELQLALAANDELKGVIGLHDASLGRVGNEMSGKAILARQRQGDRGTFSFIDNLSRALRRVGKLLIEGMVVYDTERNMRLKFVDGSEDWVRINQSVFDEQSRKWVNINDVSAGKFDITVSVGPSYQTQRIEAADSLMQFIQAVPGAAPVVLDLIAKNMDWPGADEIAKRLKKIVPTGVLDRQEMLDEGILPPQPTPQQQADMAQARAQEAFAQAKSIEAQAKIAEIEAAARSAGPGSSEETVKRLVVEALSEVLVPSV